MTCCGGAYGYGTVFKLTPGSGGKWRETILHSFCQHFPHCHDGALPSDTPVLDQKGDLYGDSNAGFFQMTPGPHGAGPAWVSAIVDAVGGYDSNGHMLYTNCGYWTNTVILITWDDWGGWYDHVLPWNCNNSGKCSGYSNGQGGVGGEYVYGFRVPLLVVSAYTPKGYISGACDPSCTNEQPPYVHDFGSILNFIEYAFGPLGDISPNYQYADHWAPDVYTSGNCTKSACPYSLSDFFPNGFTNPRTFTPFIEPINYRTQCFLTPNIESCFGSNFTPLDPDADAVDQQD